MFDKFSWPLAHVGLAVSNLEEAVEMYGATLGNGGWTEYVQIHHDWVAPLTKDGAEFVQGRAIWALGSNPPLELLDGPVGSPWWCEPGEQRLHHIAYWAEDLEGQSKELQQAGYQVEYTMPPFEDGRMRGFGYHLHPSGMRIELQVASDIPAMTKWMQGEPLVLDWGF